MRQIFATESQTENRLPLTLYFDGSCRLCRSEVENLQARDDHAALVLVDCSAPDFDATNMPQSREEMMRAIHGRYASGEWIRGVDVFVAAYAAIDLDFISRALAHPLVKPRMERLYPWIARNRYWLSRSGFHHVMNWFAARARRNRLHALREASRAVAASEGCAHNACSAIPTVNAKEKIS